MPKSRHPYAEQVAMLARQVASRIHISGCQQSALIRLVDSGCSVSLRAHAHSGDG